MAGGATVLMGWGMPAMLALHSRVAVLVVIDVLSFSTTVDVAVSRGAAVLPFADGDIDAARLAARRDGAILAGSRGAAGGGFSLSPASLAAIAPGTRLMLASPNGARLSLAGGDTPVLAGCLRNAGAVARAARTIAGGGAVGVVAAGERWPDGTLRPALEDLLGAGAVIDRLAGVCSRDAMVARDAFHAAVADLGGTVRLCASGRELIERGYPDDVALAVALDASSCAPLLCEGAYHAA